jgi:hypothetical protein
VKAATSVRQAAGLKAGERGQVTVLFILILLTCILIAIVAVSVGQVLVRRQHAQMVVDAAALAGAGAQARGLNTIARWNEKSLHLLQGIQISSVIPYVDSVSTTEERFWVGLFSGGLAVSLVSDWAGDVLKDYQNIFDVFNGVINAVNLAYSTSPVNLLPFSPVGEARKVVDENFGGDGIFKEADLDGQGVVMGIDAWSSATRLVKLTDPEEYKIAPAPPFYFPNPENWAFQTCELPWPADIPCAILWGAYGALDGYQATVDPLVDPVKYKLGRFYDNSEGSDVRFCYYITVSQSPVLFGKTFFDDIPPITVAAAAKPYDGYLGDKFEPLFDAGIAIGPYGQQDGKDISYTYKPKLVPLTASEKAALAVTAGGFDFGDAGKWLTILH